jgi:hypothetical protein
MIRRIELTGDAGQYSVAGAVAIPFSRHPVVDAARALRSAGAKDSDTIRAAWSGTPITANVGAVCDYRPSPARQATERTPGRVPNQFGDRH